MGLGHNLGDSCSEGGHAYVPSVGVIMTVEGFPRLSFMYDRDDVHHEGMAAIFAMSVHKKWALVNHVYDQLVEF